MIMYVCIRCYENNKPNPIIFIYPGKFLCPKHGELPILQRGVVPVLGIHQIENDKEIFPMSEEQVPVLDTGAENDVEEFDARTGLRIIQLGENHYATERTDGLTKAKIDAMLSMPQKAGLDRNNQGKYRYTSFNQFIEHCRAHLLTNGIVLTPTVTKIEREMQEDNNKKFEAVWMHVGWKIEHYQSGQWERITIVSFANNRDRGDKHVSKAMSYNIKDMLRTVFLVPSGDEDDPDDDSTQEEWRLKYETVLKESKERMAAMTQKMTDLWEWLDKDIKEKYQAYREESQTEVAASE